MSATADSSYSFHLPSLTYIDAKWEEPNLRTDGAVPAHARKTGLAAWLAARFVAIQTWRRNAKAMAELSSMSNYELMDIGLSRADLGRVFDETSNQDLHQRGTR